MAASALAATNANSHQKEHRSPTGHEAEDDPQSIVAAIASQDGDTEEHTSTNQSWQPNTRTDLYYLSRLPMKRAYDVFVRSAIDAHCFSIGQTSDIMTGYRTHARGIWKGISAQQKESWKTLFKVRTSADDISVRGQKLLQSQGLLVKFLPDLQHAAQSSISIPETLVSPTLLSKSSPAVDSIQKPTSRDMIPVKDIVIQGTATKYCGPCLQALTYLDNTLASILFPHLVPASSTTPSQQPCFVPFAARSKGTKAQRGKHGLFVINTPDTPTISTIGVTDLNARAQHLRLGDLACRNHNVFAAIFSKKMSAAEMKCHGIILPPSTLTTNDRMISLGAEIHICRPPKVFSFDTTKADIKHNTVAKRICNEHLRDTTLSFELFRQESQDSEDSRVRYILRFADYGPEPWVQRLYFPLDAPKGGGKV